MSKIAEHLAKIEAFVRLKSEQLRLGGDSKDKGLSLFSATAAVPALIPLMAAVSQAQGIISDPQTMMSAWVAAPIAAAVGLVAQGAMQVLAKNRYEVASEAIDALRTPADERTHSQNVSVELISLHLKANKDAFDAEGIKSVNDLSRFRDKNASSDFAY